MAMPKPENAVMNRDDLTLVDGAEELSQETDLTIEEAIALTDVVEKRAAHRDGDQLDLIVEIEDWMADYWEDDYGKTIETPYLICKEVADYSEKAWKLYGCCMVYEKGLEIDAPIMDGIQIIDHATDKYPKELGETFLAKSGTTNIFALQ